MSRLTEKDNLGNWSVKGLPWNELFTGKTITKKMQEIIYGCLAKLKDYEDSELSPVQVQQYKDNNGWILASERYPESNTLVLLSFENIDIQMVGMYEEDDDGGEFYLVANSRSCLSCDLFVNAWMPLPAPYKEDMAPLKQTNGDRIRSMSDAELTKIIMCPYDTAGEPMDIMPCVTELGVQEFVSLENCHNCMMKWLKKEVE